MAGCDRADSMCWNPHKLLVGSTGHSVTSLLSTRMTCRNELSHRVCGVHVLESSQAAGEACVPFMLQIMLILLQ